jgi:hypothetical protein
MAAASGFPTDVPVFTIGPHGERKTRRQTFNPEGISIFKKGFSCPWEEAGVWTDKGREPKLLKPDYFAQYNGKPADFVNDFLKPFIIKFGERMREANEKALIFVEGVPAGANEGILPAWKKADLPDIVNAFHWYDGPTLFTKVFIPWISVHPDSVKFIFGRKKVAASFKAQLEKGKLWAQNQMEGAPSLLGEFGLPFDLNSGKAYKTGDYKRQIEALSMYYDAVDANLLSSAVWNYTAGNTHENGDNWNGEDLSIYSADDTALGDNGARAIRGWLRPFPIATAGEPLELRWNYKKGAFYYRFRADPSIEGPTEIFAPPECFGTHPQISLKPESLSCDFHPETQRLSVANQGFAGEAEITVIRQTEG